MPEFGRTLPPRPNLEQQKKLAKDLLAAFRRGDTEALARVRAELPDKKEIRLADAQYVLAREYGFTSWRDLMERVEELAANALPLIERFKSAVRNGDAKALRAMRPQRAGLRAVVNKPLFAFDSSALVSVAGSGDVDLVDALLDLGADPNQRSN